MNDVSRAGDPDIVNFKYKLPYLTAALQRPEKIKSWRSDRLRRRALRRSHLIRLVWKCCCGRNSSGAPSMWSTAVSAAKRRRRIGAISIRRVR